MKNDYPTSGFCSTIHYSETIPGPWVSTSLQREPLRIVETVLCRQDAVPGGQQTALNHWRVCTRLLRTLWICQPLSFYVFEGQRHLIRSRTYTLCCVDHSADLLHFNSTCIFCCCCSYCYYYQYFWIYCLTGLFSIDHSRLRQNFWGLPARGFYRLMPFLSFNQLCPSKGTF